MNMIETGAAPDEFCRSHGGRLARLNSYRGFKFIEAATGDSKRPARNSPTSLLRLLASLSGTSADVYLHDHSCVLFSDLDSSAAVMYRHSATTYGMLAGAALTNPRAAAYLCDGCLAEDLAVPRRPYWRRSHQVPGVAYCSKHLHPLRAVMCPDAFDFSPNELLGVALDPQLDMLVDADRRSWAMLYSLVARRVLDLPWQRAVVAIYHASLIAGDDGPLLDMVMNDRSVELRDWAEVQAGRGTIRQAIGLPSSSGDVDSEFIHWQLLIPQVVRSQTLLLTTALMAIRQGKIALATVRDSNAVAA